LIPVITYAIPPQNCELVRDQIGGILLCEFLNQNATFGLPAACTPTTVDIERFVMIDESTFPIINVSLYKGKFSEKDYSGYVKGEYTYFIDVYTGAASTSAEGGDQIATLNLQRMIGVIRAILEDTGTKHLGLIIRELLAFKMPILTIFI
jgi:hypothetical protein